MARLVGANKRFIEETIPHISSIMVAEIDDLLGWAEVIVLGQPDRKYIDAIAKSAKPEHHVIDLVGNLDPESIVCSYEGAL